MALIHAVLLPCGGNFAASSMRVLKIVLAGNAAQLPSIALAPEEGGGGAGGGGGGGDGGGDGLGGDGAGGEGAGGEGAGGVDGGGGGEAAMPPAGSPLPPPPQAAISTAALSISSDRWRTDFVACSPPLVTVLTSRIS